MSLATRDLQPVEPLEGNLIDGYLVDGSPVRYGERELIYDAVGPDGEAVSLVMAVSPMPGGRGAGAIPPVGANKGTPPTQRAAAGESRRNA